MHFRPLYNNVLVKRIDGDKVSKGGIIIPDFAQQKTFEGIVEAVGQGKLLTSGKVLEPSVKKGDHVYFQPYAGEKWEGKDGKPGDYIIITEDDIMAVQDGDSK